MVIGPNQPAPSSTEPRPQLRRGLALQFDEGLALQLDEGLAPQLGGGLAYNAFLVLRKEDASSPQGADV